MVKISPSQLAAAFGVCRSITRSQAKNFYYAFLVLPRRKRDALCAVYAFMRHADDLSDDLSLPAEQKRARLDAWLRAFQEVASGEATDEPILMALADTKQRYKIPAELLEKLIHGTRMDVAEVAAGRKVGPIVLYRTFDQLYQYCYHVASVVGLVCIRIFGYRDARAELLAERTGIAFQLTNIIRDVKEDAAMGRVYLPGDDLMQYGLKPEHLRQETDPSYLRPLLKFEADRAREYYKSGDELITMLDAESRPAMWVLLEIYRQLLEKIAKNDYQVFGKKIRLTTREKLKILGQGCIRRLKE
ncbi:MAG TPA: phytoene/squalene synthase family protein [Terriglobales bacterium]|nr:phytoene/squalene synthase family protein [Terriglobales bacterium]